MGLPRHYLTTSVLHHSSVEPVGNYTINRGTLGLNANYALSFTGANLSVTTRPIAVTADPQTKTYGDADPALTYQITSGSLVGSDAFGGGLSRIPGENVGNYTINQGSLGLSANYALSFTGANLSVTARPIAVTADPQTKTYGDADPALTYQITSGSLVGSDAFSGGLSRIPGENVGNYTINQGSLGLSANYALSFTGANLSITARPITISADGKTKVYGHADPVLTYGITAGSLVGGDSITGNLSRVAGEDVGSYAIEQGTLALSSNYSLTYVGANLPITPRPITVTADAKTKVYGDADPALTYQISSGQLVGTDAFSGMPTRLAGENVGLYAIRQGTLALSSNYVLAYVGGESPDHAEAGHRRRRLPDQGVR